MFFTTNPPSPDHIDPELIQALTSLNAENRSAADVLKFSDIDRPTAFGVMPAIRSLSTDARRFLAQQMVEQSEANVELNFSRVLRNLLNDPDAEVRVFAVQGLWEDESVLFADQLLDLLVLEDEPAVREAIVVSLGRFAYLAALGKMGDEQSLRIRDTLMDIYLSNEQVAVRRRALESVAYFSDDDDVESAIAAAFDSIMHDLRISAIFSMGRNSSDRWLSTVLGEMQDDDAEVRFEAARASGEIGDEQAVTQLLDLTDDEDAEVQMAAIGALGQIGGKVAVGALRRLLRQNDPVLSEAVEEALSQAMITDNPMRLAP